MIAVTILVLCAVSALGHPTEHPDPIPAHVEESIIALIHANREAAVLLTKWLTKFNSEFITAVKTILDNLILCNAPILNFGAEKVNYFLDGFSKLVEHIPFFGPVIGLGNKAFETHVKLWNTLGLYFIHSARNFTDTKLDILAGLGEAYLGAWGDASASGAKIVEQAVSEEVNAFNEGFHNTYSAVEAAHDVLPWGSSGGEHHSSS